VKAHHNSLVVSHPSQWKITELVTHNFWWPGIGCYVAKYIKGCDLCNQTKTFPALPMGKLMPNQVLDHHWQIIMVYLITELP